MEIIKEYVKAKDIPFFLANTPQVTFEVTDACNLNCMYCGYGTLYSDYDKRENNMLSVKKALALIDYMNSLWNSPYNLSYKKNVYISFYGGEPLMNIKFIKEIVLHIKNLNCPTRVFTFSLTTNALLLHKYMDFLYDHQFNILISLDGSKENMEYRVDKAGKSSYDRIIHNIDMLKEKYPEYFNKNVNFNSVLHNKNSVESIYLFFKEKYNKMPRIAELNNSGIRKDKIKEFQEAYKNSQESLNQSEHYSEIINNMELQLGTYQTVSTYLIQYSNFVYKNYNELLYGRPGLENKTITGTCMPFSKKIFMTVNGKLLPCERIGHQFALGHVEENIIDIDFDKIAEKYNIYYSKVHDQCCSCYNKRACIQCIFNLENLEERPVCFGYMDKKNFDLYKNTQINFLRNNPKEYFRIMKDLIII